MTGRAASVRSRRQCEALARARLSGGEPGSAVTADLVAEGLDSESADQIVEEAIASLRSHATKLFFGSVAFAVLGLLVTLGTYSAATSNPHGGQYLIWFGPVIAGVFGALVAARRRMRVRE